VPDDYEGIYIKYYLSTNETGELQTFYLENVEIYQNGYYVAEITSGKQYWPFGMEVEEYSWAANSKGLRYGFNGKETDSEWGSGNGIQDYGFRLYSPAIGKFLSVDPLAPSYPWYTPYQFAGNMPIWAIDLDGLEEKDKKKH
tara:strand:- start:22896 stop:23321 length:426 start_codon:yes stop_codon:yes gene_type:complete